MQIKNKKKLDYSRKCQGSYQALMVGIWSLSFGPPILTQYLAPNLNPPNQPIVGIAITCLGSVIVFLIWLAKASIRTMNHPQFEMKIKNEFLKETDSA